MRSFVCLRCHRGLKDPKSVEAGMGPVCRTKAEPELELDELATLDDCGALTDVGLICRREGGVAKTNVVRTIICHSPTGFEWGYAGSGPADLALNVLAAFTSTSEAHRLHQLFKFDHISPMPREGGRVLAHVIRSWLAEHQHERIA